MRLAGVEYVEHGLKGVWFYAVEGDLLLPGNREGICDEDVAMCVRVCVRVHVCLVRACMRACVRACVCVCVYACVCVCVYNVL